MLQSGLFAFQNVPFCLTKRAFFVTKAYRFCLKGGLFLLSMYLLRRSYFGLTLVLCMFHVGSM